MAGEDAGAATSDRSTWAFWTILLLALCYLAAARIAVESDGPEQMPVLYVKGSIGDADTTRLR